MFDLYPETCPKEGYASRLLACLETLHQRPMAEDVWPYIDGVDPKTPVHCPMVKRVGALTSTDHSTVHLGGQLQRIECLAGLGAPRVVILTGPCFDSQKDRDWNAVLYDTQDLQVIFNPRGMRYPLSWYQEAIWFA